MPFCPPSPLRWSTVLPCAFALAATVHAADVGPSQPPEPAVQHRVLEDDQVRIEELRVRSQTRKVVVQPKLAGARPYEIITSSTGRDPGGAADGRRGAEGQRVWNVLGF